LIYNHKNKNIKENKNMNYEIKVMGYDVELNKTFVVSKSWMSVELLDGGEKKWCRA
jgi:hypothetical protein